MRSDLTDITVSKHAETEKAVLVSRTGRDADAVWLPKSQIEIEQTQYNKGLFVVTLTERLAIEKGLA